MVKSVLDACCGSRMFWFDRDDSRALFADIRREQHSLPDRSSSGGARLLFIDPDLQADFRALPFDDASFHLVVFDPPHLVQNGASGWLAKKYGKLGDDWRNDIRAGFRECFRVLKPFGTLVFKWNEHEVKVSELLALTDHLPLFGNRCGKTAKSHWLVFMAPGSEADRAALTGERG
jgi:SAM-dependent methyltransferase